MAEQDWSNHNLIYAMAEQDWIKVERTRDLVDYAYAKYENSWKESDEVTHEMLD
ncbi:hypothetical protein Tco_0946379, partial [Tanacetum coccineum]